MRDLLIFGGLCLIQMNYEANSAYDPAASLHHSELPYKRLWPDSTCISTRSSDKLAPCCAAMHGAHVRIPHAQKHISQHEWNLVHVLHRAFDQKPYPHGPWPFIYPPRQGSLSDAAVFFSTLLGKPAVNCEQIDHAS